MSKTTEEHALFNTQIERNKVIAYMEHIDGLCITTDIQKLIYVVTFKLFDGVLQLSRR